MKLQEAYKATYLFLKDAYSHENIDELGVVLGGMTLLPDGGSADQAILNDWLVAAKKIGKNMEETKPTITSDEAYKAMCIFLEDYCSRGASPRLKAFANILFNGDGKTIDWLTAVNKSQIPPSIE